MLANGFAVFALARYYNLQRLSTPVEAKQGLLLEADITCTGIPADTWSLSELWPISWRLENTVEASSPMFYNRPVNDQSITLRPYHTDTVQPEVMDRSPLTKKIGPFVKMLPSIQCTRQPVRRTNIAQWSRLQRDGSA